MKANRHFGVLKAIAFISLVVFFGACISECDEPIPVTPKLKPFISSVIVDNLVADAARVTAMVVPNGKNVSAVLELSADGLNWTSQELPEKLSGDVLTRATFFLSGLQFATVYSYRVRVINATDSVISEVGTFKTLKPVKSAVAVRPAENIKINEARLTGVVIPRFDNTSVSFEYSTDKLNWQSLALPEKLSGSDSIQVKVDVSGLTANTVYSYRLKASNIAGDTISSVGSFKTYAVRDYDGNYYHAVTIGTQTWLQENLKTTHYLNGDPIPNLTDTAAWMHTTSGAYVYYNNDPKLGQDYGALYNWYVAADSRGLISGYHTPSDDEFVTLANFLGADYSGLALREAGGGHWVIPNGNNSSGFTALPAGFCGLLSSTGKFGFLGLGKETDYWTSFSMGNVAARASMEPARFSMLNVGDLNRKSYGLSLRLIKD